jgi:hypothetical protein
MRKTVLAVAVLIVAPAFAREVEHAPTAAQCKADATLWSSQKSDFFLLYGRTRNVQNTVIERLTAKELLARSNEMADCATVDSDDARNYYELQSAYVELFLRRMNQFIERHNLMDQFYQEDEAGAR